MKALRIVLLIVLGIALIVVGVGSFFKISLSPTLEGELKLKGLGDEVSVFYTEFGIPHIYASSEIDAYHALGYVHAQDRLWQMDLVRRVGGGRLSELFGEASIEVDKYFRVIGTPTYAKASAAAMRERNGKELTLAQAYLDGINQFIENGPPTVEHSLLQVDMEPYTLENMYEVFSYMSFSFANAQKTDPFLTELVSKLDSNYIKDLPIFTQNDDFTIPVENVEGLAIASLTQDVLTTLQVPLFIGSNSWVVGPKKSTTGNTILVNDPHIGFSQPAVWYEAHLVHPEGEHYGYFMAGNPFPPLIHNTDVATGLTMFENDDIDFYYEKLNPEDSNQYWYKGEWRKIQETVEVIHVKDKEDLTLTVRKTAHGPIVSDILDKPLNQPVSMYWVYTQKQNLAMEVAYALINAKNSADMEKTTANLHGPGLNIMFGSKTGEYAWWASGGLIYRKDERSSKTFRDGSLGFEDPDSIRSFAFNPKAVNPASGYVYSANNQPEAVNGLYYSGYYLPDDRAERITSLLESKTEWSVDDFKTMLMDEKSTLFAAVLPTLKESLPQGLDEGLSTQLRNWQGDFDGDQIAPTIYQKWVYEIFRMATQDEMDSTMWETFVSTHLFKRSIESILLNEQSIWWDDVTTPEVEDRSTIISKALQFSLESLDADLGPNHEKWLWKKNHTLTHKHALAVSPIIASWLNVGPFEVSATNEVINNLGFRYTGASIHNVSFGPSTRRIVDFSDVRNNSWSILPTGQSGNPFSPHYADQAKMYVEGKFRKMLMNHDQIRSESKKLLLKP